LKSFFRDSFFARKRVRLASGFSFQAKVLKSFEANIPLYNALTPSRVKPPSLRLGCQAFSSGTLPGAEEVHEIANVGPVFRGEAMQFEPAFVLSSEWIFSDSASSASAKLQHRT